MSAPEITQQQIKEILHYNPETGVFTWIGSKKKSLNGTRAGFLHGSSKSKKYTSRKIRLFSKKNFAEHRLAWLYVYGVLPDTDIDHINNDPLDNRICNLRIASRRQNKQNSSFYKNNKSGYKGVTYLKRSDRYRAEIRINGKSKNLGEFSCPKEAHSAYCLAADNYFGEFANYGL